MSDIENKPCDEIINLCNQYQELYKGVLCNFDTYYQLIKSIESDDCSGGLLAYYLINESDYNNVIQSIKKAGINDSIYYIKSAAYAFNLSLKITPNKPSKEEILEQKSNIKNLSRFLERNKYIHFMYRANKNPHELGDYLKSHLEKSVDKLNPIKDPNFVAEALNIKEGIGKKYPQGFSTNAAMYDYVNTVFPEVHEVLNTLGDFLDEMSEKQPIIKRHNSENIELQCFCRIFNEMIYNHKKVRNYKIIADFAEIIFKGKTEIAIDAEYVKQICRTKYDT